MAGMHLYMVYGEDQPHVDDTPYKAYLIIAADEATARSYAPPNFKVANVQVSKSYPAMNVPAARLAWVGGAHPITGMMENPDAH
jgi:hypothetical protein